MLRRQGGKTGRSRADTLNAPFQTSANMSNWHRWCDQEGSTVPSMASAARASDIMRAVKPKARSLVPLHQRSSTRPTTYCAACACDAKPTGCDTGEDQSRSRR